MKLINKNIYSNNYSLYSQSCSNIHNLQSIKGNMLSYGCLNLTFTIELNEKDLNENNIVWENIKNYNSLSFINTNKSLWSRMKLSSTNNTLQTLLHMNKILQNKIKLKHICFRKIKYQQNQLIFKDFVNSVTNTNGLYLDSHSVCPCELSIQLRLRFNGHRRLFVLCGEKTPLDDDDDEDGDYDMKEEDNILLEEGTNYDEIPLDEMNGEMEAFDIDEKMDDEEYNPFIDIPKEINNVNDFYFIYFNFRDYNGDLENTFKGKITIDYLFRYFIYLRKNFKNIKTILNMSSEVPENILEVKDLLSVVNIAIYYEKNKLFQILNNFRTEEEKIKREQEYFKHYYDNKIKNQEIKQYLDEEEKRSNLLKYLGRSSEKNILENKNHVTLNEDNYIPLFRHTRYNKNLYSIKLSKYRLNNNKKKKRKKKWLK